MPGMYIPGFSTLHPLFPRFLSPNLFLYFNPTLQINASLLWSYYGLWALSYPEVTSLMISCDEVDQQECSSADLEPEKNRPAYSTQPWYYCPQ